MKNKAYINRTLLTAAALTIGVGLSACNDEVATNKGSTSDQEQQRTEKNQKKLLSAQPPVTIDWSLERDNINKRTDRFNDPNKISYIYTLSDTGQIIMFSPLKGKPSSVNSQITNPEQTKLWHDTSANGGNAMAAVTLPSPAEDGSYGTNGDAIFWFTPRGTYHEWNGKYHLADEPFKLSTPPIIIVQEDE